MQYWYLMAWISLVIGQTVYWDFYSILRYIYIWGGPKSKGKIVLKEAAFTLIPLDFFLIDFVELLPLSWIEKGYLNMSRLYVSFNNKSMKREYRHLWIIQEMICVMKSSLKIVWISKTFSFSNKIFFSWKSIFSRFYEFSCLCIFLTRQILQKIDVPWQKPWHLPTAEPNFECCN